MDGLRPILVVDDSSFFRDRIKRLLYESKITKKCIDAKDGNDAIRQYQNLRPDLVIMDVFMPNLDGINALKAIMHLDPKAKVIMFSGGAKKEIVQDAMKLGAKEFVLKPFDNGTAVMTISKVLNLR